MSDTAVELLLFEVGGRRFAAEAATVVEITGRDASAHPMPDLPSSDGEMPSGTPLGHGRGLAFTRDGARVSLAVDAVLGVRRVEPRMLRRLPKATHAHPWVVGLWIDPDPPVVLIDLRNMDFGNDERR